MPSAAAPPQSNVAGPPRTELEELQIKANQVTDDVSKLQLIKFSIQFCSDYFGLFQICSLQVFGEYSTNGGSLRRGKLQFVCRIIVRI